MVALLTVLTLILDKLRLLIHLLLCYLHFLGDPASKSTSINWQDGMDLTKKVQREQVVIADRKRKHQPNRTFFTWFLDNKDPSADDIAEVRFCS